ncbi:hypothetical protein CHUAL_006088 [Chamberlinius hualienensis]
MGQHNNWRDSYNGDNQAFTSEPETKHYYYYSSHSSDSSYYAAVYSVVSVLIGMLLVLLVYVACSKRYRLNWFEKTVLQSATESSLGETLMTEVISCDTVVGTPKSVSSQGSVSRFFDTVPPPTPQLQSQISSSTGTEFWVPPSLQRQASICQTDTPELSGDDSQPATPNTPMGTAISPFTIQQSISDSPSNTIRYPLTKTPSLPEEMRGSIQFTISYDPQLSLLHIDVIQARDLVPRDFSGTADPYIKVRLLPECKNYRQSRILKKTLNPQFDEEFAFEVATHELSQRTLELLVYDFDQYSRHQCMGSLQLSLEHIDLSEKVSLWKGIHPCDEKDDKADLGDIMFSLGYLPSAGRLTVVVLKARNLRPVDEIKNTSDTNVKVTIIHNDRRLKKKKTATQRGSLNPVFNEALTFSVSKEIVKTMTLEFVVGHDNILGQNNQTLGRVLISSKSKGEEGEHFAEMLSSRTAVARWHALIDP